MTPRYIGPGLLEVPIPHGPQLTVYLVLRARPDPEWRWPAVDSRRVVVAGYDVELPLHVLDELEEASWRTALEWWHQENP